MNAHELAEAVLSSGYTPAVRDGSALIELLGSADDAVALGAERALARLGHKLAPLAERACSEAAPRVRARLCRAIGRVSPLAEAERTYLITALGDDDPKTRRNAAIVLGKAEGEGVEDALVAAWDREERTDHLRTLAASLGKVGKEKALTRLRALSSDDPELRRIASQAILVLTRSLSRGSPSTIEGSGVMPYPVPVVFRCRSGLEPILEAELGPSWSARVAGKGSVRGLLTGSLESACRARTAIDFAIVLPRTNDPSSTETGLTRGVVEALTSKGARDVFRAWTRGQVRYRLAWSGGGHHRADVWRVAKRAAEIAPELVNDPTDSTWEILVRESQIEVSPRKLVDPRFAYRVRDVPAASHPTIAAALARIAGIRTDDVVWDPFVGSATDLVERAKLGPYREVHGSDVDPEALDAARANLDAAGVKAELSLADACTHAPRGVTLILTNPPMGHRVLRHGNLSQLLERFVGHAATVLEAGGRLVWISPMGERSKAWGRAAGLHLELAHDVDMGGFPAQIQVMRK